MLLDSYEGLPPTFTLGYNMLAGAFAGIAVGDSRKKRIQCTGTDEAVGAYSHVPC